MTIPSAQAFIHTEPQSLYVMGFGSYDESEQENQQLDMNDGDDAVDADGGSHEGSVEFDNGASNDELLDRLQDIKDD